MKVRKALTVLVIIAAVSSICFAQDPNTSSGKIDLKLRLKAGESHEMKTTQTQNITQTVNGQEQKMKQVQEMVLGLDCLSVDANGVMDTTMTYKSMKMTMAGPMGTMEFDTAKPKPTDANKPQEKMVADLFSAIVGSKFQMKIKPNGETYDIRGLGEMVAKIKEKVGSGAETQEMGRFFDKLFDENQIKEMTGTMMTGFPAGPVSVGDSWYDTISMNLMMPIDIETTYLFKSRKDGIAYIDAVAKFDMGDTAKPIEMGPDKKMSMQLAGTINASSQVDEATGLTRKSNIKMNFSGVVKMEANSQMPEGMTIPMTIAGDAVVELIK
ncbi:MAG: DUF6263 family protein [Phycisphaerae bacterium]|nr:DUF6263 family protein [Phycisphaerae bacterium]